MGCAAAGPSAGGRHGAGARERAGVANVLRAFSSMAEGRRRRRADRHGGRVELLETTIDDATAELLAYAADRLQAAGALDVWFTPALMKKGRPGHVLHVLARQAERAALAELLLRETTTFGLRVLPVERVLLDERREAVEAAGGTVGVRLGYLAGPGDRLAGVRGLSPAGGTDRPAAEGSVRGRAGGGLRPLRRRLTSSLLAALQEERFACVCNGAGGGHP